MLTYVDTDIVFQELPDEVTLAVNLAGCPCRCPGCHSKHLWANNGTPLTADALDTLIASQSTASGLNITCVSLMGGDAAPGEVNTLLGHVRQRFPQLHTSWWSGRSMRSPLVSLDNLDYLKLGPYLRHLGPLRSSRTNQRLYRVVAAHLEDITHRLQHHALGAGKD